MGMKRLFFIVLLSGLITTAVSARTIVWPDGTQCTGQCTSSGHGTLLFRTGSKYVGSWKRGLPDGRGKYIGNKGDRYEGNWKQGKRHGIGTASWPNGATYKGRFKDGLRDGTGTMQYPDNAKYTGRWRAGLMHGKGTFTSVNGSKYIGHWRNGKRDGTGTLYTPDGRQEKIHWKDGKRVDGSGKASKKAASSGTGFYITYEGHVVTNSHVVHGCKQINISHEGVKHRASIVANDRGNDLALLKVDRRVKMFATFRGGGDIRTGENILALGYPFQSILSDDLKITNGMVNSLAGLGNDTRMMQISAPVQPGNSGGPLLDQAGNVVGVVTSKMNAVKMMKYTGDVPQNINFAVKASVVRNMLVAESIDYETAPSQQEKKAVEIFSQARQYTVLIECNGGGTVKTTVRKASSSEARSGRSCNSRGICVKYRFSQGKKIATGRLFGKRDDKPFSERKYRQICLQNGGTWECKIDCDCK